MIGVAIPYFQRRDGVLRKALASIAAQRDLTMPVHVIVVDDGSPVDAHDEVASIAMPSGTTVEVIRQANAGPGAARNTALDRMPASTRYIAFLDSDDAWADDHLARALAALQGGFDFYFANHLQLEQSVGAFERAGRLDMAEHPPLPDVPQGLHAYGGDLREQILFGNVIGTSTVVFRRESSGDLRFNVDFRSAGEDYLFWLDAAARGVRTAFSTRVACVYGRGVNVYAGVQWGTRAHLIRIDEEIRFRDHIVAHHALSGEQARRLREIQGRLRDDFAAGLLSLVSHGRAPPWSLLARRYANDPSSLVLLPRVAMRLSRRR
jgi:succinoglycan biosynthesis protein ExoW